MHMIRMDWWTCLVGGHDKHVCRSFWNMIMYIKFIMAWK